jgi:hypothetical protein
VKLILFLLAIPFFVSPAFPHDSWLSRNGFRNSAGEWCCGEGDCGVLVYGRIGMGPRGYEVNATFRTGEGSGAIDEQVIEFIPYSEALPSQDGRFWRCHRPDGSRRCFFHPPPAM